jgi:hypothetical protein
MDQNAIDCRRAHAPHRVGGYGGWDIESGYAKSLPDVSTLRIMCHTLPRTSGFTSSYLHLA